jgi:DNA primase small subunit
MFMQSDTDDPGRVCIPVDPAKVHEFDPETVPTVGQLLVELERAPATTAEDDKAKRVDDWEYTSLKPYVEMFERHVAGVMQDARATRKGMSREYK